MDNPKNRVLLVVDGSYQSLENIHYVSQTLPSHDTEVVMFHVVSKVPDAFRDIEKDPGWQQKIQTVRSWEIQQEKKINDFMQRACVIFTDAGFPDSAVKVDVRPVKEGIARDIRAESHLGYDSVILGRRGLSTIQDLSLGGVASRVVIKTSGMAVWLIGGRPEPNKFIVGMDSSEGCLLAVKHLARITRGFAKEVLLFMW